VTPYVVDLTTDYIATQDHDYTLVPTQINSVDVHYNYGTPTDAVNKLTAAIFNGYTYAVADDVITISGIGTALPFTNVFGKSVIDSNAGANWVPESTSLHKSGATPKTLPKFFDHCIQRLAIGGGEGNNEVEEYALIDAEQAFESAVGADGVSFATDILSLCDGSSDVNSFLGALVEKAINNGRGGESGPVSELFQAGDTLSFILRCSGDGLGGSINFADSAKSLPRSNNVDTGDNTAGPNSLTAVDSLHMELKYTME
jgi:hypothetical protein